MDHLLRAGWILCILTILYVLAGDTVKRWAEGLLAKNDHRWFFYKNSGLHRRLRLGLIVIGLSLSVSAVHDTVQGAPYSVFTELLLTVFTGYAVTYIYYRNTTFREKVENDNQVLEAVKFVAYTHDNITKLREKFNFVACFDPTDHITPIKVLDDCKLSQCIFYYNDMCCMMYHLNCLHDKDNSYIFHYDTIRRLKPDLSIIFRYIRYCFVKSDDMVKNKTILLNFIKMNIDIVHSHFMSQGKDISGEMIYFDGKELYKVYKHAYDEAQLRRSDVMKSLKNQALAQFF